MIFNFFLDDIEVDEPQGFSAILLNINRDDNWHGIFFEASTSNLVFTGEAAAYLKTKRDTDGLRANIVFKATQACGIYDEQETIFEGKVNLGKYRRICGTECSVSVPVEQTGCIMKMRNRYDQKVDMNSQLAFDKLSPIVGYAKINFDLSLPPQDIAVSLDCSVEGTDTVHQGNGNTSGASTTLVRPTYNTVRFNNIHTGNPQPENNFRNTDFFDDAITPQILYEETPKCFSGTFQYNVRTKGTYDLHSAGSVELNLVKVRLVTWDGNGEINNDSTLITEQIFYTGSDHLPMSGSFDATFTGTITLTEGIGLYAYVEIKTQEDDIVLPEALLDVKVIFDSDTSFLLEGNKSCQATNTKAFAVHECLSHVLEAITDGCLKVKSEYYGRTDSQPYAFSEDGCGSLRILTSGLYIRNADNPTFFASFKDLFDGLRGIDNIGIGTEGDSIIRVEPIEFFYQDVELLSFPFVPRISFDIQEQLHYSKILIGYNVWQVEDVNGLDEFNSTREYRTSLDSVNNTIDAKSSFVAGGYPIEISREQNFADTGAADTKFDNEIFIICVERDAYGFHVEKNNIENAEDMYSPTTAYNWRIRPFYNLMRWFKSIANSYTNIIDTTNKLFFTSGEGNILASGEIAGAYPTCKLENSQKRENQDLTWNDFQDINDAKPIYKPEYITFTYALSVGEYKTIKANPYGYIKVQCGTNDYVKGFIQKLSYRLIDGTADFTLKLKWE